ncbi:MAG: PD40 domain-containing protein [Bdellovibrionaceae bacterium]|nr:PD40 domain-containing protein [Bdellovibrionales bacterium]MCB9086417.1 PD40 domain-containing protein [Pseudobdellovibrionaceae bacterium]
MRIHKLIASGLVAWGSFVGQSSGETIVQKRLNELPRILTPTKMTVGPDDNFQVDVDSGESLMVFTRRANLSTQLYSQRLNEVTEHRILDDSADSRSAILSPSGKTLAFIYYKADAQGDLCEMPVGSPASVTCYKIAGSLESPSWFGEDKILFVRRKDAEKGELVLLDRKSKKQDVLDEGDLWSTAVHPAQSHIAYVKADQFGIQVRVRKVGQSEVTVINVDLPGVSGFPEFSPDGQWIYFSHYFSDSNRDQKIDASDNSVIFRARLSDVMAGKQVIPQQLTSSNENCSFPRARKSFLYVTCDFEGSLDVYRLPLTGVVPESWDAAMVSNAHRTSRNYGQRILLANGLYYRGQIKSRSEYLWLMLSNFVLKEDAVAGRYYLGQLIREDKSVNKSQLAMTDLFLQASAEKNLQISNQITSEFRSKAQKWLSKAKSSSGVTARLTQAAVLGFLNQWNQVRGILKSIKGSQLSGLDHYLYHRVVQNLTAAGKLPPGELVAVYQPLFLGSKMTDESRLYYLYEILSEAQLRYSLAERQSTVVRLEKLVSGVKVLVPLLNAEEVALKLVADKTPAGKAAAYRELDKIMSENRAKYFVFRTLAVRSIDNFIADDEFKYLNYVATTWLKYTQKSDTEFAYARQIYVDKVLARAYGNFGEKKYRYASNHFYGSLSLTDDLESHYGYIKAMELDGKQGELATVYDSLTKRGFVSDNLGYVQSLMEISNGKMSSENADKLLSELHKIDSAYQSPMYQLLLGYLYLKKLELSLDGLGFSQDLLASSHKHLMLAYDLGRENRRIAASALSNLATLHFFVANWGLSRRFFELREPYGFVDKEEEGHFRWFFARTLYQLADGKAAAEQMRKLHKGADPSMRPLLEQQMGFYLLEAGRYSEAAKYLSDFLKGKGHSQWNLARARLALAYSLMKAATAGKKALGATEKNKIVQHLDRVVADSKSLTVVPAKGRQRVQLTPLRIRLLATGLKAQLISGSKRTESLNELARQLEEVKSQLKDVSMTPENWLVFRLKGQYQMADLEHSQGNKTGVHQILDSSWPQVVELAETVGYGFHTQLIEALVGYWGFARLSGYEGKTKSDAEKLTQNVLAKMAEMEDPSGVVKHHSGRIQRVMK